MAYLSGKMFDPIQRSSGESTTVKVSAGSKRRGKQKSQVIVEGTGKQGSRKAVRRRLFAPGQRSTSSRPRLAAQQCRHTSKQGAAVSKDGGRGSAASDRLGSTRLSRRQKGSAAGETADKNKKMKRFVFVACA